MDHSATPVGRRKGSVSALSNELFKHRRQSSSLSTSASASVSVSSNRTRVLPFATARTLQPISAASAVHAQGTTTQVLTGARSRATTTIGGSDTPSKTSAGRGDSAPARAKAMTLPYDSDSRGEAGDLKSPPVIAIGAVARSTATGQVYFPAAGHPGFALAQPRRVITVNGAPLSEALFAGRQNNGAARAGNVRSATTRQPSKSHLQSLAAPAATNESQSTCGRRGVAGSIGLSSIKPSADSRRVASSGAGSSAGGHSSGARTKPIIGLGLTLNPADAVVTLQPKRSTQLRSRPIAASGAVFATAGSRRQTAAIGRIQRQQVVQRHGQASALAQSRASAAVAKSLAAALPSSNRSSVASPLSTGSANSGSGSVDGGMRGGEFTFKSPLLESCISLNDLAGSPFPEDPKLVMLNSSKRETSKGFLEMTELRTVPDAASHGAESPSAQPLPSVEGISAGAASAAAAVQMDEVVPSMDDLRDFVSCASPATTADAANDASETSASTADAKSTLRSCQEPRVATCVLCFEQVLISKKRGHVMRCPSCSSQISEQSDKQQQVTDKAPASGNSNDSSLFGLPLATPTVSAQSSGTYNGDVAASLLQPEMCIHSDNNRASPQSNHTLAEHTPGTFDSTLATNIAQPADSKTVSGGKSLGKERALLGDSSASYPLASKNGTGPGDAQALQPHIASEPLIVASAMVDAAMPIKCDLLVAPGHPSPVTGSGTRGQTRAPQPLGTCSPSAIAAQISQQAASTHMDRCTTHPGTRNDLWCETCEMAICTHCAEGTGIEVGGTLHHAHSVVKLAAAYDDTFEAIESLQIKLVGNLSETRQRNALLDSALAELAESYARAQEAMDEQLVKDTERVEKAFRDAQAGLQRRLAGCAEWRSDLDETLKMVQQMVEDFSQAQAVSERSRILELLTAASQARPDGWNDRLPDTEALLASEVKPAWRYATLPVPSVLDLGRKRGHVRVVSDPFSAHGVVWQVEARRSRSRLGVPCLSVTVNCTEGCEDIAGMYRISVHLVKAPSADVTPRARASSDNRRSARLPAGESTERFKQQFEGPWRRESSHTFMLCALDALQESDALSDSGSTTVRFGVVPESFRSLAQAQEERIRVLEERIRGLQRGDSRDSDDLANGVAMSGGGGGGSGSGTASLRPSRRRRSEGRGWATSPRVARRSEASMSTHSRTRSGRAPAQPLPLSPQPPPPLATGFTFSSQQSRPVQNQHPSPMLLLSPVSHIVPSSSSSSDCAAGASSQSIVGQPSPSGSRSAKAAQRPNSLGIVQRQQQQQQAQPVSPTSIVSPPQTMAPVLYSDPQSANSSSTGGFTLIGRGSVSSNNINAETGTGKPEHRRAISLTTKLRRQPPIPFPLNAQSRSLTSAGSSGSQSSSSAGGSAPSELVSPTDDKAGVLRRLSGWVRNTEGRFAQQAKRVRQLAAAGGGGRRNGSGGVCGEIDDWTFLDKSFSPNFPRSPHRMVALGIAENGSPLSNRSSGRRPLWPMRAADADAVDTRSQQQQHQPPPPSAPDLRPLQALSARAFDAAGLGSDGVGDVDVDDGFAFDGAADIQRVQEEVDARAEHRRLFRASAGLGNRDAVPPRSPSLSPSPPSSRSRRSNVSVGALQARYDSILQRVDALQLIANTVENSRDGFTEGTLRRVSSELGMLMDGRRRRLEEARAQGRGGATSPRVVPPRVRALSPESFSSDLSSCDFGEPSADSEGVLRGMRYYALGKPNHAGAFSRRSVSMGPAEIRRAVMRCDLADGDCDGDDVPVLSLMSPTASSQQQQPPSPTPSVKSVAPVDLVQGLLAKSLGTMSLSSPRLAAFRPSNSPALSRNAELRVVPGCASMAKSVSEPARLSSDGVGAFPSSMPETVFSLLMSPELSGACKDARMNALIAATHPSPAKDGVPLSLSSSAASSGRSSQSRRLSITSASSTSSVGRSPARITRPGGSNGKRRESFSGEATPLTSPVYSRVGVASVSRSGTPVKAGSSSLGRSAAAQLTPQANRKGGILKAGRSRRATPARLHTLADLPSLNEDGAIGADVSDVSLAQAAEERVWAGSLGDPAATGALGALQEERVGKARRSSTLPAALDEPRLSGASTPPSREHSAQRQPRSARTSRKRVRFPEERRLLETIRLIDPRVAQSIEQRAAIKAAGDGEDTDGSHHSLSPASLLSDAGSQESTPLAMTPAGALRLSPPPAFRLDGHQQSKEDDEDDECDVRAFGGLAARVRLSPRLSAKSLRPPPAAETHFDNEGASSIDSLPVDGPADPVFCSLAEEYSPAQSSDRFDTATSVLFDEAADQPIHAPEAAHAPMYKRPPIPPQLRSGRADGAGEELPGGVCLDSGERMLKSRPALIFDRSGLLSAAAAPGSHFNAQVDSEEASSPGSEFDDDDDDNIPLGRMYRNDISSDKTQGRSSVVHTDSSLSDLSLPLIKEATLSSSMLADEQNAKNSKTSRRVLHVGPNVASAQSSPQAKRNVKSSNESSPSDGDDGLVAGPSLSTHLYRGDVKAFGSEQIPAIAHGRDTAFKGLLKPSSGGHVQGSDLMC